ncbi:parvin gamma [Rhinolophus ferrumequinum]|uniref:Parvin gamma n=1 Tax=Rhinolophus ferrumequinum TaxID=59479 RepID=A0A7J7WRQ6_RHIFE|nr:parvin gamma [Rhinolophus ferrumequinum]
MHPLFSRIFQSGGKTWGHNDRKEWWSSALLTLRFPSILRGAQRDLGPGTAEGRRPAHLPRQPQGHCEQRHQEHTAGPLQPVLQAQAEREHGQEAWWIPELTITAPQSGFSEPPPWPSWRAPHLRLLFPSV